MGGSLNPRGTAGRRESGAVLVEFALVALVFYLLLAGIAELGRMILTAQMAQNAARVAARELALAPLPALVTFEEALQDPVVRATIYDPQFLVIDLDLLPQVDPNDPNSSSVSLDDFFATLPLVNQALRPAMVFDDVSIGGGPQRRLLRMPGALLQSFEDPGQLTVAIPRVVVRSEEGAETIEWVDVLEEVRPLPDPGSGSFSVLNDGVVSIRVNVPYQSAMFSGFRRSPPSAEGEPTPNLNRPILALDGEVVETNAAPGNLLDVASGSSQVYAGPYGLGRHFALGEDVRPFRKLVGGQAVFRREVFAEQAP